MVPIVHAHLGRILWPPGVNKNDSRCVSTRVLLGAQKNPHEMGSKMGNVKIGRKVGRPQIIEKIGSSGWIRTSNPPVNRLMQVGYLVGSSCA